ncbi:MULTISPECIES: YhjD/YihY/BrkB family envelope integrity protein [unclassified Kribbella]|uniref:YhjD/YihY/BrkB family envelope integrity protein n=1 Tax=unclassified Kribbella TaxID=2644121 RepID=UPI0033FB0F67
MKQRWVEHPRVQQGWTWVQGSIVWRIVIAALQIRLYDRALSIAGKAFIALVPLLIVVATLLSTSDAEAVANWMITRFGLTGTTADTVRSLFSRPPSSSGGLTILSVLTVLISASSFARSIQRTYEVAWDLPARGLRRTVDGIQGAFLLLLALVVLASIASLADDLPGGVLVTLALQTCAAVPGWWLGAWLLLSRRVAWRLLLPGAVVSALAQTTVSAVGARYVPYLIEQNTERYGVIGVAIAIISWLVILALVIVGSAVVGAQLGAALARHDEQRERAS